MSFWPFLSFSTPQPKWHFQCANLTLSFHRSLLLSESSSKILLSSNTSPRNNLWLPKLIITLPIFKETSPGCNIFQISAQVIIPREISAYPKPALEQPELRKHTRFLITAFLLPDSHVFVSPRMWVPLGLGTVHMTQLNLSQCLVTSRCTRKRFRGKWALGWPVRIQTLEPENEHFRHKV